MTRNPFEHSEHRHRKRGHVLLVLDDLDLAAELVVVLEREGFRASWVSTADEAFAVTRQVTPDLIVAGASLFEHIARHKSTEDVQLVALPDESCPTTGSFDRFLHQVECVTAVGLVETLTSYVEALPHVAKRRSPSR